MSGGVNIAVIIEATPEQTWDYVEQVERHTEWMVDAAEITFHGEQRRGVGTRYTCLTRIGPFRLHDVMEITRWEPALAMGVHHSGAVTGAGTFLLEPVDARSTRFRWFEDLHFPWWLGGRAGLLAGRRVMSAIWRRNLRTLKRAVEDGLHTH